MISKIFFIVGGLGAAVIAAGFVLGLLSSRNSSPGLTVDNLLKPCPDKPNCVSSELDTDPAHKVDPLPLASVEKIKAVMTEMGAKLVTEQSPYLAFTVTSSVFGFVDDVEFRRAEDVLHVRSASRVGHSDLGVNRDRVNKIRFFLTE